MYVDAVAKLSKDQGSGHWVLNITQGASSQYAFDYSVSSDARDGTVQVVSSRYRIRGVDLYRTYLKHHWSNPGDETTSTATLGPPFVTHGYVKLCDLTNGMSCRVIVGSLEPDIARSLRDEARSHREDILRQSREAFW